VGRPAPIHKVVGTSGHAGLGGTVPVLDEARIEVVAAFRRLDEGELRAGRPYRRPIDLALPARHVDAVDRERMGTGDLGVALSRDGQRRGRRDLRGWQGRRPSAGLICEALRLDPRRRRDKGQPESRSA
jgi:hypothetical protein